MAERRQSTIVGVFAVAGLAVMVALVVMFGGGRKLFARSYDLNVIFPEGVVGVQEGQRVTLFGKRVGDTRAVTFVDENDLTRGVRVIIDIDEEFDLPAKSEVVVAASIMGFGRPAIRIEVREPLNPARLAKDNNAMIMGRMIPTLDQVLPKEMQLTLEKATQDIGNLASALTPVAGEVKRLLEARNITDVDVQAMTANFDTVIQRLDGTLKAFNTILANPQNVENVMNMLASARRIAENGALFTEDLRAMGADGKVVIKDVHALAGKLMTASDELTTVLRRLDLVLNEVNAGKGTAGLFVKDNRLYEEMVLSARRLTKAIDEMREVMDMAKKGQLRVKAF